MNNDELFYKKEPDFFIEKIKNKQHFRYSRFNDGEIIAASGISPNGHNCDKHQYFPEMGVELEKILLKYEYDENYIIESFDYWYNTSPFVFNSLNNYKLMNNNLCFVNDDFIRYTHEQIPEKYIELLNVIFKNKVCIVGPKYLLQLNKYFNFDFIEVPIQNCYLNKDLIIKEINDYKIKNESDVIYLFSASMLANIIIDKYGDLDNTYIDWGSVLGYIFSIA